MITEIKAGAKIDTITADELREVLRSWQAELTRGARFRRRSMYGVVDAAGALAIGGGEDGVGPAEGMVWAVTRLSVAAGTMVAAGLNVYANDANPGSLLWRGLGSTTDGNNITPGDHAIVLNSGDQIIVTGAGLTVAEQVVVNLTAKEVPAQMAWSL